MSILEFVLSRYICFRICPFQSECILGSVHSRIHLSRKCLSRMFRFRSFPRLWNLSTPLSSITKCTASATEEYHHSRMYPDCQAQMYNLNKRCIPTKRRCILIYSQPEMYPFKIRDLCTINNRVYPQTQMYILIHKCRYTLDCRCTPSITKNIYLQFQ
jgi:hypothetical protein